MPVNLSLPETIHAVPGLRLSATGAGLKADGKLDMVLITLPENCTCAGTFTQSASRAAPVRVCRSHLADNHGKVRALLINSGGANAATGSQGYANAAESCRQVAQSLSIPTESVLPFSTGVIGEQLPMDKISAGITRLVDTLGEDGYLEAATGILTTDLVPKIYSAKLPLGSDEVTITGFAKGSGMIAPDMATMLAYIFTDAAVPAGDLQSLLDAVVRKTFNSVTVDGDTSTNDSCVLAATAQSGLQVGTASEHWSAFSAAVESAALFLAQALVRDGEGATKFIRVHVSGGDSEADCHRVGMTIANSPLVKTAFFASDANLGRIVMAAGRSGVDFDMGRLSLQIGDVRVLTDGEPDPDYSDDRGQAVMAATEIDVAVDLGMGDCHWTTYTCDFSYDYVKINAEYRS